MDGAGFSDLERAKAGVPTVNQCVGSSSLLRVAFSSGSRLREPGYREFIANHGFILVEGFNDVIGLDNLCVPSLGITSNRMTESQGEKVIRFAKQLGVNRVNLMFDCEETGDIGAKDALWFFAERGVETRLLWSTGMFAGQYKSSQPESISRQQIETLMFNVE